MTVVIMTSQERRETRTLIIIHIITSPNHWNSTNHPN